MPNYFSKNLISLADVKFGIRFLSIGEFFLNRHFNNGLQLVLTTKNSENN